MSMDRFGADWVGVLKKKPPVRKGLGQVLKANPYHDAAGRFATRDSAKFVSIGGAFAKSNARDKERVVVNPKGRTFSDEDIKATLLRRALLATFTRGQVDAVDFSKRTPEDRIAYLKLANSHVKDLIDGEFNHYNMDTAWALSPEQRTALSALPTAELHAKLIELGVVRKNYTGRRTPGSTDGTYSMGGINAAGTSGILLGMDKAQRQDFSERFADFIATSKGRQLGENKGTEWNGPQDIRNLRAAGFDREDLEHFSDALDKHGTDPFQPWTMVEKEVYGPKESPFAYQQGQLWAYSKNKDVAINGFLSAWSMAGDTEGVWTARRVAEAALGLPKHWEDSIETRGERYMEHSPRLVEHMKTLKKETEEFYAAKLNKSIKILRGVGVQSTTGKGDEPFVYTPGAIESWTTLKSTASLFGKMMGGRHYAILATEVKYKDLLFSYESVAGKYPHWPIEKALKGKKEFVPVGPSVQDVDADIIHEAPPASRRRW